MASDVEAAAVEALQLPRLVVVRKRSSRGCRPGHRRRRNVRGRSHCRQSPWPNAAKEAKIDPPIILNGQFVSVTVDDVKK
jgi:hypothetical protein